MYNLLIPFLVLLSTFIPPMGGVIMADFWLKHKGRYPTLDKAQLPDFNRRGLAAYALGAGAAYFSPLLPPLIGVVVAAGSYAVLLRLKHATLGDSLPSTAKQ